eukprot:scaffold218271_cov36-Tisochrysis_lutea.AAC.1
MAYSHPSCSKGAHACSGGRRARAISSKDLPCHRGTPLPSTTLSGTIHTRARKVKEASREAEPNGIKVGRKRTGGSSGGSEGAPHCSGLSDLSSAAGGIALVLALGNKSIAATSHSCCVAEYLPMMPEGQRTKSVARGTGISVPVAGDSGSWGGDGCGRARNSKAVIA